MSENTKIEWCDHTFNPWEGCQKAGPGCDNCYAEKRNARFAGGQAINWGPGAPRRRTSASNWNLPKRWNAQAAAFFAVHGRRQRVFCASLADVFDNAADPQWRADLFELIAATPNLDWLLLTKRIGNVHLMIDLTMDAIDHRQACSATEIVRRPWPWPNVWLGATIVNQAEADRDIPKLLAVPAAKRFLSMEPLLGQVDLTTHLWGRPQPCDDCPKDADCDCGYARRGKVFNDPALHWVIVGGESGPGARPMHPDWARSLRDQCQTAGVPFLFKQWGEWTPGENVQRTTGTVDGAWWVDGRWMPSRENLARDDGHHDEEPDLYRVGKKAAGRHLDGRTWDEAPI